LLVKLAAVLSALLPAWFVVQLPCVATFVALVGNLRPSVVPYALHMGATWFYRVSQCGEWDSDIGLLY